MKLNLIIAALLAAGALAAAPVNAADRTAKGTYSAEKDRIDAEYKRDVAACSSLAGNAKDICRAEAKGKQKVARADAYAGYRGTPESRKDAQIARADAAYDVAKEKCDDQAGNPKDVCVKEAKAAYTKAKADANADAKVVEVRKDAAEETRDANYKVAKERCDALAGDAKDRCISDAKARFGKS